MEPLYGKKKSNIYRNSFRLLKILKLLNCIFYYKNNFKVFRKYEKYKEQNENYILIFQSLLTWDIS